MDEQQQLENTVANDEEEEEEEEDVDVESISGGSNELHLLPKTPPPSFSSLVDTNGNFSIAGTPKQPGASIDNSETSLEDSHSDLSGFQPEPEIAMDYGIV